MTASKAPPLRLLAQDIEDLAIISAAVQDAVLRLGDISYEPKARRLTLAFNRYRWEAGGERIRSGLQLGGVLGVQARKLKRGAKDAVVEILAVNFEPGAEPPGGCIVFSFAGDADLKAEVECIDAILADVSAPWPTPRTPTHDLGEG
ncbi:MAG: DUF2948 family protein [Phenylobacterium sp.]|jgi:hypothetical protein|uniref:DUF2948 family protein n=1 Tax=Phenylobacterium sp. TaxID=1871053 RepID=UPI002A31713D|nr:DUF2948 family protein [Phenylobacterium sp.]MDD3838211.1 DUF2948 family protein [Phenylobacterium sp.]MDX9999385.1 DUF2948 family protein [Phenylobacterium sp.]